MYFGCKVTKKRTKHKGNHFFFGGSFEIFMPYLCIDLRTILRSDRKAKTHKDYPGVLTRDGREHFTFIETVPQAPCRRNLRVFDGKYITITRRSDGSLWPNFKAMRLGAGLSVEHYAFEVYRELLGALKGLVEENEIMKE